MNYAQQSKDLAEHTQERLRAAQWKHLISIHLDSEALCKWATLIAGGLILILLQNAKDTLEIVSLDAFKQSLILLIASSVLGLVISALFKDLDQQLNGSSKLGKEFGDIYTEHRDSFQKIYAEAQVAGVAVEDPLDIGHFFTPIKKEFPTILVDVARELSARENDPDRRWTQSLKKAKCYSNLVILQIVLLLLPVLILIHSLKAVK